MSEQQHTTHNRLWGMRCYLIGAMDRVKDGGVPWRKDITPFLEERGVVVLDPTDKPIGAGREDIEDRKLRKNLKECDQYDELQDAVHLLRVIDLRMVDNSCFLICNINVDIHACGTYEEMSWANRMKRPILVHVEQGKENCPDWLFGMLPHEHIFGDWKTLKNYLVHVDGDESVYHHKRWMFFDYTKMMPKVPPRYNPDFKAWST